MMPSSSSEGISRASASALRTSETVTCAPLWRRKSAAARPDLPSPTTKTFLPFSSIMGAPILTRIPSSLLCTGGRRARPRLAQFERGECKQCKHQGPDPEAGDDLGLAPAQLLEVVVQRRHLEDTLLAQLIAAHLQHHGDGFQDEDAADEG